MHTLAVLQNLNVLRFLRIWNRLALQLNVEDVSDYFLIYQLIPVLNI